MPADRDAVTATQAAALLGVSERTVRRKIAAGEIRARHIARNRFAIALADLPLPRATDDTARRMTALERRVALLEVELHRLGGILAPAEAEAVGQFGVVALSAVAADAGTGDAGEGPERVADAQRLYETLLQLAEQTRRLAPLLTPPDAAQSGHGTEAIRPTSVESRARGKRRA